MEVRKLNHVLQLIRDILENKKRTAEEHLQLNKICELEDKFVKGFSKEKWKEYFNLSLEIGCLHEIETDQLLDFAIELLKEIKF